MNEPNAGLTFIKAALMAEGILIWAVWAPVVRRRARTLTEELPNFVAIIAIVAILAVLATVAEHGFEHLPRAAQAGLISRIELAIFLFWLVVFSAVAVKGAWRIVAAFGLFGLVERPVPSLMTAIAGSDAEEFWTLCGRAPSLARKLRVLIWLRHEAFAVAVLFVAGFGVLMTFGLPKHPLWIYLAAAVLAAILLHPARSDARMMARLFAAHEPSAHTA
jgi:hypothetical protein